MAKCTRSGGPQGLNLYHYVEALKDASVDLTYSARVGLRKQSVEDAERLFSPKLADFMERNGYKIEAAYIQAVNGWRRACDQRGLSEEERSCLNYNLLDFILDDWMPWHRTNRDFSLLEVNRFTCIKL